MDVVMSRMVFDPVAVAGNDPFAGKIHFHRALFTSHSCRQSNDFVLVTMCVYRSGSHRGIDCVS
jgi:hypothetical protein